MSTTLPTPDSYEVLFDGLQMEAGVNGRFLAGEYPSAKGETEAAAKITRYLDAGVTFFLDLTEVNEYGLRQYAAEARRQGMARGMEVTHQRLPIPDMDIPPASFMEVILNKLDRALAEGHTVYVHCYGGIGRTGTVVGCWLARHGLDGEAALRRIAAWRAGTPDGRRTSPETHAQREMVRHWPSS
jgi:hypothetical protein